MKQRVVITGAAGFIGSHLAETLLDRDYTVIGIDNLLTGDTANIAHLANRDFTFIKHDVTNYIYVEGPVDFVLHWPSPRTRASSSPRPPRCTAIRSNIRRRKATGATSTRSARAASTTRPSASP